VGVIDKNLRGYSWSCSFFWRSGEL